MADPPPSDITQQVPQAADIPLDEIGNEGEDAGLVLVKEGYFRYIDILFEWCKYMNPWQKNAVKALLNAEALTHPDHPLHVPGQDGVELYISTAANGRQNLLFSLRQIEYLQHYIHHQGLADPRVVKELTDGGEKPWPKDFNFDSIKVEEWIPLPMNVLLPSEIGEIQPVILPTLGSIKREMTRISKHNKAVKREAMMMRGTPQEKSQAEAEIDNEREGPGLRSGPRKPSYQKGEPGAEEVKGWGGGWGDPTADAHQEPDTKGTEKLVVNVELEDDPALDPPSPVSDATTNIATPNRSLSAADQSPDTPAEHYYHAQQALFLASQGGLVGALNSGDDTAPEGEPADFQKRIGRSLFLALDLVTYEKDESVVLEIGWSAVWWQLQDPQNPTGGFEQMSNKGHYIVQDHLLKLKNGEKKPNHRDNYLFGSSLPVQEADIGKTVDKLVSDLSAKAGGGPIYMVLHSVKSDEAIDSSKTPEHAKFVKIGLYSVDWVQSLRPTISDFPPYADESGLDQIYVADTAKMFANVDGSANHDDVSGKTPKSLDEVAHIMFGLSAEGAPQYTANAGNRASYTMEVFLSLLTGPDLKDLREDYRLSQNFEPGTAIKVAEGPIAPLPRTKHAPMLEPVTFVRPAPVDVPPQQDKRPEEDEEDDDDDEDGDIKGVFFETEDGGHEAFNDSDDE